MAKDTRHPANARRLEWTLLAFFLLTTLFALVVYVVAPSVYSSILLLHSSPADSHPLAATLFLLALVAFLAILTIGVRQHWRWLFWLLMIAFGAMIIDVPVTIFQLVGIMPEFFPVWYNLCRMGVSLVAVGIAVWMFLIYRHGGVWGLGKKVNSTVV